MAVDLAAAQAYYNTLTPEQKAAVDAIGGPSVQWLQNAITAGVPKALKASGQTQIAEGGGEEDIVGDWQNAAPSSEWLGKRKPTPGELRRYAFESGGILGEDYARNADRVLAKWIRDGWDVAKGGFFTTSGRQVAKPPDVAGDGTWVSGYEDPNWRPPGGEAAAGGGGGGVGGGAAGAGQTKIKGLGGYSLTTGAGEATTPEETRLADLQRVLEDKFLNRGGMFGFASGRQGAGPEVTGKQIGQSLQGGGLWWGGEDLYDVAKRKAAAAAAVSPASVTPAAPAAPTAAPAPAGVAPVTSSIFPGTLPVAPPAGRRVDLTRPIPSAPAGGVPPVGTALQDALMRKRRRISPDWVTDTSATVMPATGGMYA
jgi:hypothetical protein